MKERFLRADKNTKKCNRHPISSQNKNHTGWMQWFSVLPYYFPKLTSNQGP